MVFDIVFITIGGARFFGIAEFEELQRERAALDYHTYLLERKDCFFIRLITCPLCFSLWVSIGVTLLTTDSALLFPICNILGLIVYKSSSNLLNS
jgi:hypothetical protein